MKGNPKVIAQLNKALQEELTAINQYFLHAEMCENWGYHRLSELIRKQSIGEMKHAEVLIERILFLDGSPSMMPLELKVGGTVKGMIQSDLALEVSAVEQYNDAVAIATKEGDNGSRDLLVELLKDEEDHVDFLEAQMHQIEELGYERYLTSRWGRTKKSSQKSRAFFSLDSEHFGNLPPGSPLAGGSGRAGSMQNLFMATSALPLAILRNGLTHCYYLSLHCRTCGDVRGAVEEVPTDSLLSLPGMSSGLRVYHPG